jgi:nitrogen fixation NifU-like protein
VSIEDLYRQVILDHYRSPHNRGSIDGCDAHGEGHNPLCGDEISIDLVIDDDTITDVAINGQGCSISQASASMMSEAIKGRSLAEVETLIHRFKVMMNIEQGDAGLDPNRPGSVLGDLEALQGVRKFPVRIKCASLAWTTLEEALATRSV